MLPFLAPHLTEFWGPFRLLGSSVVLIGIGTGLASLLTLFLLPRFWRQLPLDRGRDHAVGSKVAAGKPTGGGLLVVIFLIPCLALVLPFSARLWEIVGCLVLCMLTGYLDDRSEKPWGELMKGGLDLVVAILTSLVLCQGQDTVIWLPLIQGGVTIPAWAFVPVSSCILWFSINATNCSDGVDGLAGSLTLLSLFYLGALLYVVIGHREVADYLLVPHRPLGAAWALLVFTSAGGLAGYLWHNAQPSAILMGDAGSRFLGLLVGIAVMVSGSPVLILVAAPVVLANGGTGLFKIVLLRFFRWLGCDISPPADEPGRGKRRPEEHVIRLLHRVRFPLHDHCRNRLGWSNTQVLLRFVLLQAFITPLLLVLLLKLR